MSFHSYLHNAKLELHKINMALYSAATTVKLFSIARASPIASLSAGRLVAAAPNGQQKRSASGGKNIKDSHHVLAKNGNFSPTHSTQLIPIL